MITSQELREKYIKFFEDKGHRRIPSAPLVPENDPTVLFTTAGMHPLVPYLMGEVHPEGQRLVSVQKCVRTGDVDDVGDSTHNTFFEMLGNWSLGDYFKEDSIRWSFEFLTDEKWLGIDPGRLKVTVFAGDQDAPRDEEAIRLWKECFAAVGVSAGVWNEKDGAEDARIFPLSKDDNWWGPAGITGPCGPDTEIFIDLGRKVNEDGCDVPGECRPGCHCGRYVEIWNNVFMEYNKTSEGDFEPLKQKNVDTGMGLERTVAMLGGFDNSYECDVLRPLVEAVQKHSPRRDQKAERIVADHLRTGIFMLSDGVTPSNLERGYILRRLIRRAIRNLRTLETKEIFWEYFVGKMVEIYGEEYVNITEKQEEILVELRKEEGKFARTLEAGLREIGKLKEVSGRRAFYLFQTFGFPLEMIFEEMKKRGVKVAEEEVRAEFEAEFKKHQELSRTASAGKFQGGLADHSEETTKLHTAAHLLLQALREVLGEHVYQKGSNITAERLRFDFSHPDKLTDEEKRRVEDLVNAQIEKKLPVHFEEMPLSEAQRLGAMGIFEAKYGDRVKVYVVGSEERGVFSREICGGPHVENTSTMGHFRIKKEESSAAGVRRIKAILE